MSESSMWGRVRKALAPLDPVRIENRLEKGTPDVWYVEGAIELKWCRKIPKRGGIVHLDHELTQEQRVWAIRRAHAGGRTWVLLKLETEYMLFKGEVAAEYLGYSTLEKLREVAVKTWKKLNDKELREILMQR